MQSTEIMINIGPCTRKVTMYTPVFMLMRVQGIDIRYAQYNSRVITNHRISVNAAGINFRPRIGANRNAIVCYCARKLTKIIFLAFRISNKYYTHKYSYIYGATIKKASLEFQIGDIGH